MKARDKNMVLIAAQCDQIAGGLSESGKQIRAWLRKKEKRKRQQFKRYPK